MRQLNNLIKAALRSILKNRMRSLLTSLGIIIGVAAVIVMVAIGEGASFMIESQISSLGTDLIMVRPGSSSMGGVSRGAGSANKLTLKDVETLNEQATLLKAISPSIRASGQVIGGGNNWNTSIEGVTPGFLYIKDWEIESGECFSDKDVVARKKICVLGKTVADELFPESDPIGEKIRFRNTPFTVIGVLKEKGQSAMGMDQDDLILAPSTTVLYRLKGGQYIDMIYASSISSEKIFDAEEEIEQIMREAHRIKEEEEDDFSIQNQAEIIDMASSTTEILTLLLGSIAAVSLLVGGIGIMNIMLVSVTERTREIGIRLSVGARESDVLTQFLAEAMVLSLTGGIIGILLATAISLLVNNFSTLSMIINPSIALLAFSFSGAVGIFFGFYPAKIASALIPIDALRYE